MHDRMFKVIVLGGIALVGTGCGGTVSRPFEDDGGTSADASAADASDAGADVITFPSELPVFIDADLPDGFVSTGPM